MLASALAAFGLLLTSTGQNLNCVALVCLAPVLGDPSHRNEDLFEAALHTCFNCKQKAFGADGDLPGGVLGSFSR